MVDETSDLMRVVSDTLRVNQTIHTVGELEHMLLELFPVEDAEPWDRMGLLVGNPAETITKVAIALDPTISAVRLAAQAGANVLLTHHPVFLDGPIEFIDAASVSGALPAGSVVYEAASCGVSLMNVHTALDASEAASHALPSMLGLVFEGIACPIATSASKGYGQICSFTDSDAHMDVAHLAARCTSVFGRQPRIWGDASTRLRRVVTCTGSLGDVGSAALRQGYQCVVCGEVRYHDALALIEAGLSIIELGHDVSELPLVAVLAATLKSCGVPESQLSLIDQSSNWSYPECVRI